MTYDYRGIGASRLVHPRRTRRFDKLAWGAYDCDAALQWAVETFSELPLHVVARSIGGMMVGLAAHDRFETTLWTDALRWLHDGTVPAGERQEFPR